jgi:uncharacterized repeat protein (TIGR03803 family)
MVSFDGSNGAYPYAGLTQGRDGFFYGVTRGGDGYAGTVFKMSPEGAVSVLHHFCSEAGCSDGSAPSVDLLLGTDGNFYGTTEWGGTYNCGVDSCGTIFKITPSGVLTTLYSFCPQFECPDGGHPQGGLVQGPDGNFYGTTFEGNRDRYGNSADGAFYRLGKNGDFTVLHMFTGKDSSFPSGRIIRGTDGNFYGTTLESNSGFGTVYRITPSGEFTSLHSFVLGKNPDSGVIQASDGNFYGTTSSGGTNNGGVVFRMTPRGAVNILYNFCSAANCADGNFPTGGLTQGNDGNFYGTTVWGGDGTCNPSYGCGVMFQLTPEGDFHILSNFTGYSDDGARPMGSVLQATNGSFYLTTEGGGISGVGTIYRRKISLPPFVSLLRPYGRVGWSRAILGQGFKGTTAVSFSGTPASYTVQSSTVISAIVPPGATTGVVTVTTPSGILTSNQAFRVTPVIRSFGPQSGPVGSLITIIGTSLSQVTAVTVGGVQAGSFTADSDSQVTVIVPPSAKAGHVGIVTNGGKAYSVATFTVSE